MRKYMVLKLEDLRKYLTPEEQQQLQQITTALVDRRAQDPAGQSPHYFVLNMRDKYALPAVEAYINEIDMDDANRGQTGVRDARTHAHKAREWAISNTNGDKVPT